MHSWWVKEASFKNAQFFLIIVIIPNFWPVLYITVQKFGDNKFIFLFFAFFLRIVLCSPKLHSIDQSVTVKIILIVYCHDALFSGQLFNWWTVSKDFCSHSKIASNSHIVDLCSFLRGWMLFSQALSANRDSIRPSSTDPNITWPQTLSALI